MPINLKKFEQIVTDHFATVTDEEFLENLRKCSPYLFTDDSEAKKDIHISNTSELNSNNCHEVIDRQSTEENKIDRYRKIIKSLISNYANLENYFENVTQEQFAIDLEKYCPELIEPERDNIDNSCLIVPPILDRY